MVLKIGLWQSSPIGLRCTLADFSPPPSYLDFCSASTFISINHICPHMIFSSKSCLAFWKTSVSHRGIRNVSFNPNFSLRSRNMWSVIFASVNAKDWKRNKWFEHWDNVSASATSKPVHIFLLRTCCWYFGIFFFRTLLLKKNRISHIRIEGLWLWCLEREGKKRSATKEGRERRKGSDDAELHRNLSLLRLKFFKIIRNLNINKLQNSPRFLEF